jgi:hypothetical protein
MTHPKLGWNNLRFDGDDAVHMAAFNGVGVHVTACDAFGAAAPGGEAWPHEVDAQITCPDCVKARDADWSMAQLEAARRDGDTSSLTGTLELDEVEQALGGIVERLANQAGAMAEHAIIGNPNGVTDFTGVLGYAEGNADTMLAMANAMDAMRDMDFRASSNPVTIDVSQDYLFGQDKVVVRARRGDAKVYETVENPVTPAKLDDAMESLAHKLAASPLAALRRAQWWEGEQPDGIGTAVHAAIERAQHELEAHPFSEKGLAPAPRRLGLSPDEQAEGLDEVEFTPYEPTPEDASAPGGNWCHVHNRVAMADSEQCVECDGEQGEEQSACGPDCEHGS